MQKVWSVVVLQAEIFSLPARPVDDLSQRLNRWSVTLWSSNDFTSLLPLINLKITVKKRQEKERLANLSS